MGSGNMLVDMYEGWTWEKEVAERELECGCVDRCTCDEEDENG